MGHALTDIERDSVHGWLLDHGLGVIGQPCPGCLNAVKLNLFSVLLFGLVLDDDHFIAVQCPHCAYTRLYAGDEMHIPRWE